MSSPSTSPPPAQMLRLISSIYTKVLNEQIQKDLSWGFLQADANSSFSLPLPQLKVHHNHLLDAPSPSYLLLIIVVLELGCFQWVGAGVFSAGCQLW